jgi:gluconolactonase
MVSDSVRELNFQGVYKVSGGKVTLLVDSITKPNGIAFWKNEKTLIVACSDPDRAVWYLYDFDTNDSLVNERLLLDATPLAKTGVPGLPDGLKVDKNGNIFATGPGGVFIFDATGKQIGKINIPHPTSNIALADDDKTMYITADMYVLRVKMR